MTQTNNFDTMMPANPVPTVAPIKEVTDMTGATKQITALYCRLSQEDERSGESLSIENRSPFFCSMQGNNTLPILCSLWMTVIPAPTLTGRAFSRCWQKWKQAM